MMTSPHDVYYGENQSSSNSLLHCDPYTTLKPNWSDAINQLNESLISSHQFVSQNPNQSPNYNVTNTPASQYYLFYELNKFLWRLRYSTNEHSVQINPDLIEAVNKLNKNFMM